MTREEILAVAKPILFNTEMVWAVKDNRKTVTRRPVKPQPVDTYDCQHEMQTYDQMLPNFYKGDYSCACRRCGYGTQPNGESMFQPPYCPGDILYVRETFCPFDSDHVINSVRYAYKADSTPESERVREDFGYKWRPSIHMPREAARLFLRVTDVRVKRLQDITEEQAKAEGAVKAYPYTDPIMRETVFAESKYGTYLAGFECLWNKCYAAPRGVKGRGGVITHYESYPFEEIRETRTYKGKPWYVIGNPWVWGYEFGRMEAEK